MKEKSITKKVLTGNLTILLISLIVLFTLLCYLVCSYQLKKLSENESNALDVYTWEVEKAISDVIDEGRRVLVWPSVTELLKNEDNSFYVQYDLSEQVKLFMDNITSSGMVDYTIYTENSNVFRSKYVDRADELNGYYDIKSKLAYEDIYIIDEVYKQSVASKYLLMYLNVRFPTEGIMECRIYLPENTSKYEIDVVKASEPEVHGELRKPVNNGLCVSLHTDVKSRNLAMVSIIFMFVFFAIAFIGLVLVIMYRTTRHTMQGVTDFISGLSDDATYIEEGYFNISQEDSEELRKLKSTVGNLLGLMKEITESHSRIESEKREVDIHLLRKQLNPHTLYNSLSAIRLHAFMSGDEYTISLIDTMIEYYRAVLNKGNIFHSLRDEIQMIEKFVRINEMAQGQKFDFHYEIPNNLMPFRVPAMLLHVFVENSVGHGLGGNKKDCAIFIKCMEDGDFIKIVIEDNGYGISDNKLAELNNMTDDYKGYGIKNAYQRMKMTYGERVSMHFESKLNEWTRVTLSVPNIIE